MPPDKQNQSKGRQTVDEDSLMPWAHSHILHSFRFCHLTTRRKVDRQSGSDFKLAPTMSCILLVNTILLFVNQTKGRQTVGEEPSMAGAHSHNVLHSLSKQILSSDNQTNSRQTVGEEPSMAQACSHIVLQSSSFKHDLYFNKTKKTDCLQWKRGPRTPAHPRIPS